MGARRGCLAAPARAHRYGYGHEHRGRLLSAHTGEPLLDHAHDLLHEKNPRGLRKQAIKKPPASLWEVFYLRLLALLARSSLTAIAPPNKEEYKTTNKEEGASAARHGDNRLFVRFIQPQVG